MDLNHYLQGNLYKNPTKRNNVLANEQTRKNYKRGINRFTKWAKNHFGIIRYEHIIRCGFTVHSLIQNYVRHMEGEDLSPETIHTYLLPVCKGFGIGMEEIDHPRRTSDKTRRNVVRKDVPQEKNPRNQRLIKVAKITGIRRHALLYRLNVECLKKNKFGHHYVEVRDKGGKYSYQLISAEEAAELRYLLTHDDFGNPLKEGEAPFSEKDKKVDLPLSKYRIERAKEMAAYFEEAFNGWKKLPVGSKEREEARAKAEACRQGWIDILVEVYAQGNRRARAADIQKFRADVCRESRIFLKGGNRENAIRWGRPLSYDRVAVRLVSVFALSHWTDSRTLKFYLTR